MTDNVLTIEVVSRALAQELTTAYGARLGGEATSAPSEAPAGDGWTLTVPVSGSVTGRLVVWIDRDSAAACARVVLQAATTPGGVEIAELLTAIVHDAAVAVQARPDCPGVVLGTAAVTEGLVPAGLQTSYVAVPNVASCVLAIGVARPPVTPVAVDDRLGAVLGVDLPLVVRFGRTTMPMRSVAELGPGSVVDMGRSPDEPVDVLVGDRLIARGEVVVVGGNYGVRIIALASGQDAGAQQ